MEEEIKELYLIGERNRRELVCRLCRGQHMHRDGCPWINAGNEGYVQAGQGIKYIERRDVIAIETVETI